MSTSDYSTSHSSNLPCKTSLTFSFILCYHFHSYVGDVGSSLKMPSLSNSSGFGRCWIFCSRLSARICFASSFCFSCNEGAAVESGRMFPKTPQHQNQISKSRQCCLLWRVSRTFNQLLLLRPLLQPLLQMISRLLTLELCLSSLNRSTILSASILSFPHPSDLIRCSIGIMQDIPVLQVLGLGAHLQVFLERFLTLDWGEWRLVDIGVRRYMRHVLLLWRLWIGLKGGEGRLVSREFGVLRALEGHVKSVGQPPLQWLPWHEAGGLRGLAAEIKRWHSRRLLLFHLPLTTLRFV